MPAKNLMVLLVVLCSAVPTLARTPIIQEVVVSARQAGPHKARLERKEGTSP